METYSESPRDTALDQVADFNPDLAEANGPTSLVLSGNELITMTESQWKQVLTVHSFIAEQFDPVLTRFLAVRRGRLCADFAPAEAPDRSRFPGVRVHGRCDW